jgi:hypothetical protein
MKMWTIALLSLAALVAGCNKEGGSEGAAKTGGSGDKIGIQECDEYIAKMESCISKAAPEAKGALEQGLKASRDAWKASASGPGKDTLKTTCKTMLDALAQNPVCK